MVSIIMIHIFLFYVVVHDHPTLAPEILEKFVSDMTHMYYNWPGTFVSFWLLMFKLHFLYFVYVYNLFSGIVGVPACC